MKQKFLLFSVALILMCSSAFAEEQEPLDFDLVQDAVQLAAQADAYNIYCDKESDLAGGFIKTFENRGISEEQKAIILDIKVNVYKILSDDLEQRKPDCKNVDFLLERLKPMRILKAVSFALNGIDPSTLPDGGAHVPLDQIFSQQPL